MAGINGKVWAFTTTGDATGDITEITAQKKDDAQVEFSDDDAKVAAFLETVKNPT